MHRLPNGGGKKYFLTVVPVVLLGLVVLWVGVGGSPAQLARDFEECVEQVEAKPALDDERKALLTSCNARFAGRRKVDGGYIYYDFMQDRKFDIAGPNPTAEEHKQIDHAYMGFLEAQGREAVSAQWAKRQDEQLTADLGSALQPAEPAMLLKPTNSPPMPAKRPVGLKSTRCEDGSLSCSWARISAAVKNAFASSSLTRP
jgi:hypothetical protein